MVVVLQRFVLGLNHSKLQNIDEKDMITSNFLTFWKLNTHANGCGSCCHLFKTRRWSYKKNYFVKPEVQRMDRQHLEKNYPSSWGFFVLNFRWFVVFPDSKIL